MKNLTDYGNSFGLKVKTCCQSMFIYVTQHWLTFFHLFIHFWWYLNNNYKWESMAACSCGHLKNQEDKLLSRLRVELSKKEIPFLTKIGLKKDFVFIFYFDSYLWSSFEYKKLVIDFSVQLSKKAKHCSMTFFIFSRDVLLWLRFGDFLKLAELADSCLESTSFFKFYL